MIKKLSLGLLLVISTVAVQAQSIYSQESLEKASQEELSLYLTKALKTKKTGGILLIAAPASAAVGLLMWTSAWSGGSEGMLAFGTGLIFGSLVSTAVGIPVRITGSSRVKRVTKFLSTEPNTVTVGIVPCSIYNLQTQNIQPGVKLTITF